jgi:hypothetical protein
MPNPVRLVKERPMGIEEKLAKEITWRGYRGGREMCGQ